MVELELSFQGAQAKDKHVVSIHLRDRKHAVSHETIQEQLHHLLMFYGAQALMLQNNEVRLNLGHVSHYLEFINILDQVKKKIDSGL